MRSDELRALQTPLKAKYREDPDAASVTLRAEGELDSEGVSCSVQTGRALVEAGLHPASGGDGTLACSGDMLLEALVACAGVTLRSVAVNRDVPVTGGRVIAEGDLDFRGTMAVNRETPVGFRSIRLRQRIDQGRYHVVGPALNAARHSLCGQPEENERQRRRQVTDPVLQRENDRIVVHLPSVGNEPDAADPIKQDRTNE